LRMYLPIRTHIILLIIIDNIKLTIPNDTQE